MSSNITVTFLGTTSGGGPTETRNCSSLVVNPLEDGSLWMVDCAEGTVRQFAQQPSRSGDSRRLRISQVSKIFITHMHADHCMGVLTVLRNALGIPRPPSAIAPDEPPPNTSAPRVEIFGPRGIRRMLRTMWHLTHTHSEHAFVVHELLFQGETPSVAADVPAEEGADEANVRRESECVGRDIWCDAQGFWHAIIDQPASRHQRGTLVDAGPIEHRDPCIGYIIREIPQYAMSPTSPLPRKLVILGDTYDPSPLIPLIYADPPFADGLPELNTTLHLDPTDVGEVRVPVSLLIHEATDAYLPPQVDQYARTGRNRTEASVEAKTRERGHSTPAMAGAFAKRIGAERLVLNHIGARFPAAPPYARNGQDSFRLKCMHEIERQAEATWNSPRRARVQAAWDFLAVQIPANPARVLQQFDAPGDPMAVEYDVPIRGTAEAATRGELPAEVEMAEASSARGPGGGQSGGDPYGASAESMGARHDREHGQQGRKRAREWSAGRGEGSSGSRQDRSGSNGGRGGYESRRDYGTSSGRGGGGGYREGRDRGGERGDSGGRSHGSGRGGGEHKRARGRGGGS